MEKKSGHYTEREKILLATLIKEYSIIENKQTDAATVQKKQQAWDALCHEFNAQAEVTTNRNATQLNTLWKNLKQKKRQQTTSERHQRLLTGGGPPEKVTDEPLLDLIEDAAPYMDVVLENNFDSTATLACSGPVEMTQSDDQPNIAPSGDTLKENTSVRKNVCSKSSLRVKRMKKTIDTDNELHQIRIEIANLEKERAISERNKAKYEEELARLKLKHFIDNN